MENGEFGMVDHQKIKEAVNCKHILTNLKGNHPIKDFLFKNLKTHPPDRIQLQNPNPTILIKLQAITQKYYQW